MLKLSCKPLPDLKLFKKERGMELVYLPHFAHDFWEKYFSGYISLTDQT